MSQPFKNQSLQVITFLSGTSAGNVTDPNTGISVKNKDTIPFSIQVMTTDAIPVALKMTQDGTDGTLIRFNSEIWAPTRIRIGMYLYNNGQKRKITHIYSQSLVKIQYAFTSTVTAQDVYTAERSQYRWLRVEEVGTDTGALFDGVPLKPTAFPVIIDNPEVVTYDSSVANQQFRFTLGL